MSPHEIIAAFLADTPSAVIEYAPVEGFDEPQPMTDVRTAHRLLLWMSDRGLLTHRQEAFKLLAQYI